ncbi:hypothetical protein E8E12_000530 [Didymella heteroderae]|uniref:DUF7492 domain-containing protein n=1 Tax=Didymella heteroderae TaxID=1769908 RepID=A0A9P5BTU2_9PLEO|nr:hypothetical protein E8E12_000530 [Didymella heteroderae]
MPSVSMRTLVVSVLCSIASAHSWIEQLTNVGPGGTYFAEYGYPRAFVDKGVAGFNQNANEWQLPAPGQRLLESSDPLCHPDQRDPHQSPNFPRLKSVPGGTIAMRYAEGGHVTMDGGGVGLYGKPKQGGTAFVFGTSQSNPEQAMNSALEWTRDGTGGDRRGRLLASQNFDDGRCYENNNTPLASLRRSQISASLSGQPGSEKELLCETDVQLPPDLEVGKHYTLYWVWQWPTAPGKDPNDLEGKDEYYTSCIDVDIVRDIPVVQPVRTLAQQGAVTSAVPDFARRTALTTDPLALHASQSTHSAVLNTPSSTVIAGSDPAVISGPASGSLDSKTANDITPVFTSTLSEASRDATESGRSFLSGSFLTQSTIGEDRAVSESASLVPTSSSRSPAVTSTDGDLLPTVSPTGSAGEPRPKSTGNRSFSWTSAALPATSGLPDDLFNSRDQSLRVSLRGIDALGLAQFLKHLGAHMFNASMWEALSGHPSRDSAMAFKTVVANIFTQEQTQQTALKALSLRAGVSSLPACQYNLPNDHTERAKAMSVLKTVESGVLMWLAESLRPEDTPVAIMLSSMSSVAARQNARLRSFAVPNASTAAFDTPLPDVWAYNVALTFVVPGTCAVEQRLPLLPTLSVATSVATTALPGDEVIFTWDAAARAAAARSGRPLFIGWLNQVSAPMYSVVTLLGDGCGTTKVPPKLSGTAFAVLTAQPGLASVQDLMETTLAGPVVVNLVQ